MKNMNPEPLHLPLIEVRLLVGRQVVPCLVGLFEENGTKLARLGKSDPNWSHQTPLEAEKIKPHPMLGRDFYIYTGPPVMRYNQK